MRLLLPCAVLLGLSMACEPPSKPFDPTQPHRYRVLRGDNWQSISSKRDVDAEELRAWNGLREEHVLIPGQVLWIFPNGKGAPAPGEHPAVAAGRFFAPEADPPVVAAAPEPPSTDGVADADPKAAATPGSAPPAPTPAAAGSPAPAPAPAAAPSQPQQVAGGFGPGGTALLSLLDEAEDAPKLEHVPSNAPDGSPMEAVLASRRGGLGGGGEVDGTQVEIGRVATAPEPGIAGPDSVPQLPKAEPRSCLPAKLDQDIGEYGMAEAAGLDKKAIRAGMRPVLQAVQACLPGGGKGPHELHLEVSIGCDGLVYDTRMVLGAGLPEPVLSCVEAVADQASFAAAAGATTFLYPVIIGY